MIGSIILIAGIALLDQAHAFVLPRTIGANGFRFRDNIRVSTSPTEVRDEVRVSSPPFENFDYLSHWYPVLWDRDLLTDKPTKVTVFDEDYVLVKTKEDVVYALKDRCPHRSAALSEGRVTKCGEIQCAYHGWIFDKEGTCIQIPQASENERGYGVRSNAESVPTYVHQNMIWIFPGGVDKGSSMIMPPSVPELEEGYHGANFALRDFPLDWPILIENIMDPDHGMFAHSFDSFDFYSASRDTPQSIEEKSYYMDGRGWQITSSVDAVYKLKEIDSRRRNKPMKKKQSEEPPRRSTTTFVAPNLIYMGRRDPSTNQTNFVSAFWICPVGVGRSRFMAAVISKKKLPLPRWIGALNLLNFLDQDTYLLITSQKHLLAKEATSAQPRKQLYAYRSPTEKLLVRLGAFFDATLRKVPNRSAMLKSLGGADIALQPTIPRDVALDRYQQHTKLCPDSQGLLRNCSLVKKGAVVGMLFSIIKTMQGMMLKRSIPILLLSTLSYFMAQKIQKEFFFQVYGRLS